MRTKARIPDRPYARGRVRTAVLVIGLAVALASPASHAAPAGGQQVAFEAVMAKLKVGDPRTKVESLRMLAEAGYIEAAGAIIPLLSDAAVEVQTAAIDTLLSLFLVDEAYTRKLGESIVNQKGASLPLLAFAQGPGPLVANRFPAGLITGLVAAMNSPVMEVRFNAAYALGVFGPVAARRGAVPDARTAVERLTAVARDSNPILRLAGTQVLGRLYEAALRNEAVNAELMGRRTDAGDQVIAGINDPDPFVKLASLKSVGEMRLERAVQSLIDLASYYKTGGMAQQSYESLGRIAHPGSLAALSGALQGKEERIRASAVAGISRVGDKSAIYEMETRTARDRSPHVKLALAFSRARLGDLSQIAAIAEAFKKDRLAPVAFEYLIELGSPAADALAPIVTHRDTRVRAGIAEVLGIIGNEQSAFVVQSLSRDRSRLVSSAGIRSSKRLSPRPANAPRLM